MRPRPVRRPAARGNTASVSEKVGRSSAGIERRANSTAMAGASPLLRARTPHLMVREILALEVDLVLERRRHRADEAVAREDAEEGADQRGADLVADLARRPVDRAHRDDDAEHGGDDAHAGQRVTDLGERLRRLQGLVVVHLEIDVHHRLEIERADAAHDDHAHRVGEEVDGVVVGEELREAREDRRAFGSSQCDSRAITPDCCVRRNVWYIIPSISRYSCLPGPLLKKLPMLPTMRFSERQRRADDAASRAPRRR